MLARSVRASNVLRAQKVVLQAQNNLLRAQNDDMPPLVWGIQPKKQRTNTPIRFVFSTKTTIFEVPRPSRVDWYRIF